MNYEWVLFDADGTLFDYDKAEDYAVRATFEQLGIAFTPDYLVVYRRINSKIWEDFEKGLISSERLRTVRFELLFEAVGISADVEVFSKRYLSNLGDATFLIDGAEEVVRTLSGRVGLALITNGLKEVQRSRLSQSVLARYFSKVVISDEVGVAKPDAGIFDVAFARMNHPMKDDVLIVGDGLTSDIKGGSDYGIDTCWHNPAKKPRSVDVRITYEIRDLTEVIAIVGLGPV